MTLLQPLPPSDSAPSSSTLLSPYYDPLDVDAFFRLVDQTPSHQKNDLIRIGCKKDPMVLARIIWPKWKFTSLHRAFLDNAILNKRSLTLAPRGSAKSTVNVSLLSVWTAINNRHLKQAVLCQNETAAIMFLEQIQKILESRVIVLLFGEYKSDVWTQKAIRFAGSDPMEKDPSIGAYGWGSKALTGKHADILFGDDIVTVEHHDSAHLRVKFARWMGMVPGGVVMSHSMEIYAGTRYHPDDYYATMMDLGYAVNPKETREIFDYEKFGTNLDALTRDDLIWPEKYSLEFVKEKAAKPYEFKLQFLNRVDGLDGLIFRRAWFKQISLDHFNNLDTVIGVDTAYKTAAKNDYSAIAAFAKLPTGEMIVLDVVRGHWSVGELESAIDRTFRKYAARMIIVEEFAARRSENINRTYLIQSLRSMGLPVKSVSPTKDKVARYWEMQPYYEIGQIWHRPGLSRLEDEMISAPNGENDDQIDAVWLGFNYFQHPQKAGTMGPRVF